MTRKRRGLLGSVIAGALVATAAIAGPVSGAQAEVGSARQAAVYTPKKGPVFAPRGSDAIHRLLLQDIHNARGVIRGATMTITSMDVARALAAASRRSGVTVRLVVAKHPNGCGSAAGDYLRENLHAPSSITCTSGSARGTTGIMHSKVWSFERTGTGSEVVVVTSANMTDSAKKDQWNDAYQSVGWTELYDAWGEVFAELRADQPVAAPFRRWTWGSSGAYATPVSAAQDPVLARIRAINPSGARVRIAISALTGDRAVRIAKALRAKKRQGAVIRVLHATPATREALRIMRGARIPVRKVNPSKEVFLHHKFMTASWLVGGKRVFRVWTGSEVWKEASMGDDEFVLQLGSRGNHDHYATYFDTLARAQAG